MSRVTSIAVLAALLGAASPGPAARADAPDAGLQHRDIKALSAERVDDLLSGRGMGLGLAAELNGYPGPRHVLELADRLGLTPGQRDETERMFREVQTSAVALGERIVAGEAGLDELFSGGQASEAAIRQATLELGRLEGELRALHLGYHLAMRDLLTREQSAAYQELRGYRDHGSGHRRGSH
jgi:Spy/CpxP family protein refolding chaperone